MHQRRQISQSHEDGQGPTVDQDDEVDRGYISILLVRSKCGLVADPKSAHEEIQSLPREKECKLE